MTALSATGGVLTSAGIILAGTFLILLSQPVKDLAEISIGVALGVLIDTFLVRTALVPGLTLWIGPEGRAGRGRLWTRPEVSAGGRAARRTPSRRRDGRNERPEPAPTCRREERRAGREAERRY